MAESRFDVIENTTGTFGIWQFWICTIIILSKLPTPFLQGSIVYILPSNTEFTCSDPVVTDKNKVCDVKCNKYEFNRDGIKESLITEFELVCGKRFLGPLAHTAFMIGTAVGSVISGILADSYGRKWVFFGYTVLHFLAIVSTVLSPNFPTFLIFRFFLGIGVGGLGIGFVIILELIGGGKYREIVTCLYLLTFPIGLMTLAGLAYWLRYWRQLLSALALVSLFVLITILFIPESPRYLLANDKNEEAIAILTKGAKQNRLPTERIREIVENAATIQKASSRFTTQSRGSVHAIVARRPLIISLLICGYTFFFCGFIFFGILQFIGRLDDNLYLSNFLNGMAGIPGLFSCMILTKFCPRRALLIGSGTLITTGMLLVMYFGKSKLSVASAALSMFGISLLVPAMYIFIAEYFPTTVRGTAAGVSFALSNCGSSLSSFPPQLADYKLWLPPLLFSILSGIGIILFWFLPETKGRALPTNVDDVFKTNLDAK